MFACALIANAASFVLPISNTANLVTFHQGMLPLGRWLLSFGVPSLLSIATTYLAMRLIFRKDLSGCIEERPEPEPLKGEGKMVLAGTGLMIVVLLAASSFNKDLGLPTCLAALVVTAAVSVRTKSNPLRLAKEIRWSTLLLVAGHRNSHDLASRRSLRLVSHGPSPHESLAWIRGPPPHRWHYLEHPRERPICWLRR